MRALQDDNGVSSVRRHNSPGGDTSKNGDIGDSTIVTGDFKLLH
jgi:hypothetical protein